MGTVPFTQWYDDVLPYVGGCPVPVALQKIRQAAIEFCTMSRTWRYLGLTAIDSVALQATYKIATSAALGTLPAETKVVHIYQVNVDQQPLEALTPAQLQSMSDTWFSDEGDPEAFTFFNEGEFTLWRIPSAGAVGAIVVPQVALAPTETATTVDDRVFEFGRAAVAKGARAHIHSIPGKPYSDLSLGQELMAQFREMAGAAQARASGGRGHGRIRTQTIIR